MKITFTDNSSAIINGLDGAIATALEMIGEIAVGYAKLNCPVDTGQLRNSITKAVQGDTVYIGTNVEYAPYVEFGTGRHAEGGGGTMVVFDKKGNPHEFKGMRPHPFLRPALTDHVSEYMSVLSKM